MLEKDILIHETESVKDAFKKLDKSSRKVLLVIDDEIKLLGTITDGDIRRYLLKGKKLQSDIREAYNSSPVFIKQENYSMDLAKRLFIANKIELIPIIDKENQVIDYIPWDQAFSDTEKTGISKQQINIPVVIMAGGKGTRLNPFSKIFPKPLIPIGEKPVIEIIIDEFRKQGISEYFLTLNYKGKMVEAYFDNTEKDYKVEYIWEDDFLGTAGSLRLLEGKIGDTFIVSNCDVMVKADFGEVLNLHKEQNASLTILSSIQYYEIPYGITKFKKGGEVTDIIEKPEYAFTINTGVYILNRESLQFIPPKSHFNMTDLIKTLIKDNRKVSTYLVNENDYIDIGQWEDYKKAVDRLSC